MAGRPRRKRRVRTSAQRAALRKAQLASARKRRRAGYKRKAKIGASIAGSFAGAAISYHLGNYARNPAKAVAHYKVAKGYVGKRKAARLTPAIPKPTNWSKNGYL